MSTVLVADDDVDHRELLMLALHRDGHEVVAVSDAKAAFAELLVGGFDAALIDHRMPGESGIELCRRLRAEPATALVPVLLISADVNDSRIREALEAGADDFLAKPFQRAELTAKLWNLLLRRRPNPARLSATALLAARGARIPATSVTAVRRRFA